MYSFTCRGHENIRSAHTATLEFTKDDFVSPRGDCIIGVSANFDAGEVQRLLRKARKACIVIETEGCREKITFLPNPSFDGEKEMVIRKTAFQSGRTAGIHADKSASDLSGAIRERLKNKGCMVHVMMYGEEENSEQ